MGKNKIIPDTRTVSMLDFWIISTLAALNKLLVGVQEWQAVTSASVELKFLSDDPDSQIRVAATVCPAHWPKHSAIVITFIFFPDEGWLIQHVNVLAHHLKVGNDLHQINIKPSAMPGYVELWAEGIPASLEKFMPASTV